LEEPSSSGGYAVFVSLLRAVSMLNSNFLRWCTSWMVGGAIALGSLPLAGVAQTASEVSLGEAGSNAGQRLAQEGYSINTLDGVPYYTGFMRDGEVRNIRVRIPQRGNYILVVAGDNDTVDLDIYANQMNASDTSFGRTAFINFDVVRPGELIYEIDMQNCAAPNCGVIAVLLSVGR
jgi:hypothetical protein